MKLYLIGGFLGSGKTTAIQHACLTLTNQGKKVAVITNDQGSQLVDGGFIESFGIASKEVQNGCFCCNYKQLDDHIRMLSDTEQPNVIFAESVGSCTDLVATIANPLQKFHSEIGVVISVFADAYLLLSLIKGDSCFLDEKVQYIYKKQLEEADVLVINKVDLLDAEQISEVEKIIAAEYNSKTVLYQNSLDDDNIQQWIATLNNCVKKDRKSLDIDYDIYAQGEAMLGWLDREILIVAERGNAFEIAVAIASAIHKKIEDENFPIGHLKLLLNDGHRKTKISFTNTGNDLTKTLGTNVNAEKISLLINARIQAEPHELEEIVADAISAIREKFDFQVSDIEASSFKPGYPRPTFRMVNNA